MSAFRGSDERLDREIEALEGIVKVRLRRASRELRDLEKDLRELKRERSRRHAQVGAGGVAAGAAEPAEGVG